MSLSILTVTWNSADFILEQIESVKQGAEGLSYEQFIADNNSSDGTVTLLRQKYPDLSLLVNSENFGFAKANNELAKKSKPKYFLLLNPDMQVGVGSIKELVDFAEKNPKAGIVGGLLHDEKGLIKKNALPRRFPGFVDQLVIVLKLHHLFPKLLDKYLLTGFDFTKEQMVDSVQGSFLLVRAELYEKLGYILDERYYIWFEDVDLCKEAKKHGLEVWFTPSARAKDFGGRSFAKQRFFWKQRQLTKSMVKYFFKWGAWYEAVGLAIASYFILAVTWVFDLAHDYET